MIQTISTYHVQVRGAVDEGTFNTKSPLQIKVLQADANVTLFTVCADQSGLVGLIRHLHGQGFVLLSVVRDTDESISLKEDPTNE